MEGSCTPARRDTTSEPQRRNALPDAPVTVPMSGGFMETATRVEPWNTLYPTPDLFRGWVFFIPSPKLKEEKYNG